MSKERKAPSIWQLQHLIESAQTVSTCVVAERKINSGTLEEKATVTVEQHWVPCRPEGNAYSWRLRFKAAWLVFTGRADAVIWPHKQ